jgi:hypothetical protein
MLCSFVSKVLNNQYTYNLVVLLLIGILIFITGKRQKQKINTPIYWLIFIILFFLIRSYDFFQLWTLNQDEEQWIICARSMAHEPINWFRYFMVFDYTRFFTILPLAILSLFTQSTGYIEARLMQILLTIIFLVISQKALARWFNERTAWSATLMFAVFASMSRNADMIAYNSELFASILFMLFLLQVIRIQQSDKGKYGWILAGILLGLMPFAKEQSLLIALLSGITAFLNLSARKDYKNAFLIIVGGFTGFLFVFIPVLIINGLEIVITLFGIGMQYSEQGLMLSPIGEDPKSAIVFLKSFFLNKEYLPFTALMIMSLLPFYQSFRSADKKNIMFNSILLAGFVGALYSIHKPGNNFFHYSLLNWPFIILLTSFAIHSLPLLKKYYWTGAALVIVSQIHDLKFRQFYPLNTLAHRQEIPMDIVQQKISENSKLGDRVLIWGWSNKYYVLPERERGGGFLYPQFAVGNYKGKEVVLDIYARDFTVLMPTLILEIIGESEVLLKDYEKESIKASSSKLADLMDKNYKLIFNVENVKIYKKKSDSSAFD